MESREVANEPSMDHDIPPTLNVIPTIYPTSPPLEEVAVQFWDIGEGFDTVSVDVELPDTPLEILEQLGPSPFPRGRFPLIGFLATTYDKVGRYAMERGSKLSGENG